jgi:hypothetical protein
LIVALLVVEFASAIFRNAWEGGNWWGARYVAQTVPLFMIPIAALETKLFDKKSWRAVVIGLFVIGVGVQVVGAFGNDRDYLDITGQGPYFVGHLHFLLHGALDSLLIYLSPTGMPIQINPYGVVLILFAGVLGAWSIWFMRQSEVVASSTRWGWMLGVAVIGIELAAFVVWVVAPYSQVASARANTKYVAATTFLADGRTCEATKMFTLALDRNTTFSRQAVAWVEQLAPRATGTAISANDLMTDEDRIGDGVMSKDSENTISGDGAFKASTSTGQDVIERGLSYAISVEPNTRYELSGWIKTENIYGSGYGVVTVHEDNGAWNNARGTDMTSLSETRGWQPFHKTFTTLPTTRRLFVAAGLWKTFGTVWVDDVRLVQDTGTNPTWENFPNSCPQVGILKSNLPMH